jgi:hypothetical protein
MADEDAAALRLADDLAREAGGGRADERVGVKDVVRRLEVKLLLRAFRSRAEKDLALFRVTEEAEPYAGGARRLVKEGKFQVVVFGHTHHAKRVSIGGASYLNTGTWADLMRLPPAVYAGSDAAGLAALEAFLKDVAANQIGRYRRQVATFARVVVGPGEGRDRDVLERELLFFDGPGKEPTPVDEAGVLARLAPGDP